MCLHTRAEVGQVQLVFSRLLPFCAVCGRIAADLTTQVGGNLIYSGWKLTPYFPGGR